MFGIQLHSKFRALLSSYIDGQVTEVDKTLVERHLSSCNRCQVEFDDLQATVGLLRDLPQLEVPRPFALSSEPAEVRPTAALSWGAWTPRLATAAVAVFLVVLLLGDAFGIVSQTASFKDTSVAKDEPLGVIETVPVEEPAPAVEALEAAAAVILEEVEAPAAKAVEVEVTLERETVATAEDETADVRPEGIKVEPVVEAVAESAAPAPEVEAVAAPEIAAEQEEEEPPDAALEAVVSVSADQALSAGDGEGDSDGLRLPLWQLEVAAGLSAVVLAIVAVWATRRFRNPLR